MTHIVHHIILYITLCVLTTLHQSATHLSERDRLSFESLTHSLHLSFQSYYLRFNSDTEGEDGAENFDEPPGPIGEAVEEGLSGRGIREQASFQGVAPSSAAGAVHSADIMVLAHGPGKDADQDKDEIAVRIEGNQSAADAGEGVPGGGRGGGGAIHSAIRGSGSVGKKLERRVHMVPTPLELSVVTPRQQSTVWPGTPFGQPGNQVSRDTYCF